MRSPQRRAADFDQTHLFLGPKMKSTVADLYRVRPGRGRISLRNSAKLLDQLLVRIDRPETTVAVPFMPSDAASEAIREIGWESARQFA